MIFNRRKTNGKPYLIACGLFLLHSVLICFWQSRLIWAVFHEIISDTKMYTLSLIIHYFSFRRITCLHLMLDFKNSNTTFTAFSVNLFLTMQIYMSSFSYNNNIYKKTSTSFDYTLFLISKQYLSSFDAEF